MLHQLINKIFNPWLSYPDNKPTKRGWYICYIKYGEEDAQEYIMDLYWDEKNKKWKDNRRLDVFSLYDVYGYGEKQCRHKIYKDNLCIRDDVIGFKRLPRKYKYNKRKVLEKWKN